MRIRWKKILLFLIVLGIIITTFFLFHNFSMTENFEDFKENNHLKR